MRNEHNNIAVSEMFPFYPKPQTPSTSDAGAGEDLEKPQPGLMIISRDGS
jgi:hypothetical protein